MLAGRRVVLGITGGVAAYKAAYLARRLIERGAVVRTVMTDASTEFIGPHTLAAITGARPVVDLFDADDVSPHTTLGRWADAVVVAPATAATLARLANGLSDDSVSATVLATAAPVVIAPAMHTEMWLHPATVSNVERLESFGYHIVSPEAGDLAGGDTGLGRLADPDRIADAVASVLPGAVQGDWNKPAHSRSKVRTVAAQVAVGGTQRRLPAIRTGRLPLRRHGRFQRHQRRVSDRPGFEQTCSGSILRIDVDHPADGPGVRNSGNDNPFVGVAGARAEIWAYGMRQPWKFSF